MTQEPLLCVVGDFGNVTCFDPKTLHLEHKIQTPASNCRVTLIPADDGRKEELVAVGESWRDYEILFHSPHEIDSPFRKLSMPHYSRVSGLCYVNPRLIVSGTQYGSQLVVSDVNSGEMVMDLKDSPEGVGRVLSTSASSTPQQQHDGGALRQRESFVFVGGGNIFNSIHNSIRHYDLGRSERTNEVVQEFEGRGWWAQGLGYSTEKGLLFSSSTDKALRVWSVQDGTCLEKLQLSKSSDSMLFDPKKRLIFCGIRGGLIEVWDYRQTKKRVRKFYHPRTGKHSLDLELSQMTQIGDGTYVSIGQGDYSVVTWTDRGKILATAKTSDINFDVCYVGGTSSDRLRSDTVDRLVFLQKTCYVVGPTESVQVAGFFVGKALICLPGM